MHALANVFQTDQHNEISINEAGYICINSPGKMPIIFRNLRLKKLPVEQRIAFQRLIGTQAHLKSHLDGLDCKDAGAFAHGGYSIDDHPSDDSHNHYDPRESTFKTEESDTEEISKKNRILDEDKETKSNDQAESINPNHHNHIQETPN